MGQIAAEYKLQNGDTVFVEADGSSDYGEEKVALWGNRADPAEPPSLSEAMKRIAPALEEVCTRIRNMSVKPNEVEIEVGIKFVGEAGVVIAKASTEANLVVKLKWSDGKAA